MTARTPLVLLAGQLQELPSGDTIAGASGVTKVTAEVDFGAQEDGTASVTVAAATVTSSSVIVASAFAVATADHDPDDYAVEGITVTAANIVDGVGFDLIASAPRSTWGRYQVAAIY
jgi:cation transporter-like permease